MVVKKSNWYLIQSKPRQHGKALKNLANQNFECYSPYVSFTKHSNNGKIDCREPLFPGYIFIKLDINCNWFSISHTRGVSKFVRFGEYPIVVPTDTVDKISENIKYFESRFREKKEFRFGENVTINRSCFDKLEAVFQCREGQERSIILIKYIQKKTHG